MNGYYEEDINLTATTFQTIRSKGPTHFQSGTTIDGCVIWRSFTILMVVILEVVYPTCHGARDSERDFRVLVSEGVDEVERLHHQPTGSIDSLRIIKEIQFEMPILKLGMEGTRSICFRKRNLSVVLILRNTTLWG